MEENLRRVLVTTDFSECANHAILHAFRLAADHHAEVMLCHVVETGPAPNPLYAHYGMTEGFSPESRKSVEDECRRALRALVPTGGALTGVAHREILVEGDPVTAIVATAESERADLLVIATHGRTGLKRLVLGSVVECVIRQVHCPVLVVR